MAINKVSGATQVSMKQRIITGIILALVGVPCVILGDWLFVGLAIFVTIVGVYEMLHITEKKYPWYIWLTTYIFVFTFVFWVFFKKPINDQYIAVYNPNFDFFDNRFLMTDIRISTTGFAFYIALLITYSIISHKLDLNDIFYLFSMSLFLGITIQSILFLRFCPAGLPKVISTAFEYDTISSAALICYVFAGVFLNDIFAYFVGVLFGKHKMAPIISPKKTWEGFVGGVVFSTIITFAVVLIADLGFNFPILDGIIDAQHWYYVLPISLFISISAVIGDLMFSLIKRTYNIKDFGNIFPGHGGVLDRFDSLFITALIVAILIIFIAYKPFDSVVNISNMISVVKGV